MAAENDRKATGNAGANSDEVKQRDVSSDETESRPEMSRRGDQHDAGANTPSGPNARRETDKAKQAREEQKEIAARDRERQQNKEEPGNT